MCRAGVKPHVKDVGAFDVVRRIVSNDRFGSRFAPGLNATGFNHAGGQVHDLHGARVQLARGGVNKKRQRHAPITLSADAPVWPACNHVAQPAFAVFRVKTGLLNGVQCQLAQRLGRLVFGENTFALVHSNEPLCCCTINHWGFVSPAVRVAVFDVDSGKEAVVLAQLVNDQRRGFPDVQAAKQRQVIHIAAVALHRIQDVVSRNAVGDAGVKVFDAVSR